MILSLFIGGLVFGLGFKLINDFIDISIKRKDDKK